MDGKAEFRLELGFIKSRLDFRDGGGCGVSGDGGSTCCNELAIVVVVGVDCGVTFRFLESADMTFSFAMDSASLLAMSASRFLRARSRSSSSSFVPLSLPS